MSKTRPLIKYTSRDFVSIKRDLMEHAKRYYPETYRDFSEASFGSLMMDTVAYVGDILSFYLDYQVNESFLDTAVEYNNVIRHGRQLGYKFTRAHSAFGTLSLYVVVPSIGEGLGPDTTYIPTLKRGSVFASRGGNVYTLVEDVNFSRPGNEVVVAKVNDVTGIPTHYAIKAYGIAQSGEAVQKTLSVSAYEKFKKVKIPDNHITEIVSVHDSEGHEYFQVDYLSQNVIYREVVNNNSDATLVPNVLKPVVVPRRFITLQERNETFLQFGYGSDSSATENIVADPSDVILDRHGRSYSSDTSFDPSKLMETEKFGIVPANTTLRIVYRKNNNRNANAAAGSVKSVASSLFRFKNRSSLTNSKVNDVRGSLEVENEAPINGDVSIPSAEELKIRMFDNFATQNRAVTRQDYKAMVYSMPGKYGAIKRCNIVQDKNSFKRNLNLYVIANLPNGYLTAASDTLKQNLKIWLNKNRMISDTIDILDAKIINLQIDFEISANLDTNKEQALNNAHKRLSSYFVTKMEVGESLIISEIYNQLNKTRGISDVLNVKVKNATTSGYSSVGYDIDSNLSADGKILFCPKNAIFEVKRLTRDLKGVVK
jgi:hypothetical protein